MGLGRLEGGGEGSPSHVTPERVFLPLGRAGRRELAPVL